MVPTESASVEKGGGGDGGRGGEAGAAPQEGLIPPESSVCGRGGRPGRCVLEAPVGEDALGKLLLRPLEAGARAAIQGVHLGEGAGGKISAWETPPAKQSHPGTPHKGPELPPAPRGTHLLEEEEREDGAEREERRHHHHDDGHGQVPVQLGQRRDPAAARESSGVSTAPPGPKAPPGAARKQGAPPNASKLSRAGEKGAGALGNGRGAARPGAPSALKSSREATPGTTARNNHAAWPEGAEL